MSSSSPSDDADWQPSSSPEEGPQLTSNGSVWPYAREVTRAVARNPVNGRFIAISDEARSLARIPRGSSHLFMLVEGVVFESNTVEQNAVLTANDIGPYGSTTDAPDSRRIRIQHHMDINHCPYADLVRHTQASDTSQRRVRPRQDDSLGAPSNDAPPMSSAGSAPPSGSSTGAARSLNQEIDAAAATQTALDVHLFTNFLPQDAIAVRRYAIQYRHGHGEAAVTEARLAANRECDLNPLVDTVYRAAGYYHNNAAFQTRLRLLSTAAIRSADALRALPPGGMSDEGAAGLQMLQGIQHLNYEFALNGGEGSADVQGRRSSQADGEARTQLDSRQINRLVNLSAVERNAAVTAMVRTAATRVAENAAAESASRNGERSGDMVTIAGVLAMAIAAILPTVSQVMGADAVNQAHAMAGARDLLVCGRRLVESGAHPPPSRDPPSSRPSTSPSPSTSPESASDPSPPPPPFHQPASRPRSSSADSSIPVVWMGRYQGERIQHHFLDPWFGDGDTLGPGTWDVLGLIFRDHFYVGQLPVPLGTHHSEVFIPFLYAALATLAQVRPLHVAEGTRVFELEGLWGRLASDVFPNIYRVEPPPTFDMAVQDFATHVLLSPAHVDRRARFVDGWERLALADAIHFPRVHAAPPPAAGAGSLNSSAAESAGYPTGASTGSSLGSSSGAPSSSSPSLASTISSRGSSDG